MVGVQKAKAEKKGIYAGSEKCPYHNIKDDEVVGYETAAPSPIIEEKPKKKAAKKTAKKATKKKAAKKTAKKKKK